jgi:general secretion pathway protein K
VRPQSSTEGAPRGESSGFILIVVLWILAALAALASTYSVYVVNMAFATKVNDDRLQIRNAISSGVELAAYKLLANNLPMGALEVRLAHSTVKVTFVSERARVDLNAAPRALLSGLFTAVGASSSDAANFAERIAGWRKKPDSSDQNSEAEDYREAGYDYRPRQGPFQNVLELPLVLGIPPYIIERVLPLVTVYSGVAQIDIRVASPQVISALPDITPDQVQKVLAQRATNPADDQALLKLLGPASVLASASASPASRVEVNIQLDNGRTARAEVVILILKDDEEPFRVLSWRDDTDGPMEYVH